MARIRNSGTKKAVTLVASAPVELPGFCGVVSNISWDNPSMKVGLQKMFAVSEDEVIVAIEITDEGIKAKFERLSK